MSEVAEIVVVDPGVPYPGSVTVVGKEEIEAVAPQSAADVLRRVPGVHVLEEDGAGLRLNVGVRGLPPARSAKVLVLEDGVPIAPGPYGHPELYWSPAVDRLDEIEVVRGSGGIRFGPQTLGGVVNFVSAATPEGPLAELRLEGGSYGWLRAHGAAGGRAGDLGWRLDLAHRRWTGPRRIDLDATELAGKLEARLGASELMTKLVLNRERSHPSYLGLTEAQYLDDPRQNLAADDLFSLDRAAALLRLRTPLSDTLELHGAAYGHGIPRAWTRQSYERSEDGATLTMLDRATTRDRLYTVGGVQEELLLRLPEARLRLGLRAHHERELARQYQGESADDPSGALVSDELWSGVGLSGWLDARLLLGERLTLDLGLRGERWAGTRHVRRGEDSTGEVVSLDERGTRTVNALLPGAALGLDLGALELYTGVHRGWGPPQTGDAVTEQGTVLLLDAESSWNSELGARLGAPALGGELTGYWLRYENQVTAPTEAGAAADPFVNGEPTRHLGAEAELWVDPLRLVGSPATLRLALRQTVADARYAGGAYEGNLLPYAPRQLGRASVAAGAGPVLGELGLAWVGAQFADPADTVAPSPDGLAGELPAYHTLDARLAASLPLRAHGVEAWLAGRNLTDEVYIASRAPAGIQPGGFRMIQAGLSGEW